MKTVVVLIAAIVCVLPAFSFNLVDHTDKMWRWDIDSNNNVTWIEYQNLGAYAAAVHAPYDPTAPDDIERYNIEDVILYFTSTQNEDAADGIVNFAVLDIDAHWDWMDDPHVHQDAYESNVGYQDIVYLLQDAGYIDDWTNYDDPNTIAFNAKMQEYINFARSEWGIAEFPSGTEPAIWSVSTGAVKGGEWFRHTNDFWIARIDIAAATNITAPALSAAYRVQNQRRYNPAYETTDIVRTVTFRESTALQTDECRIDYATNVVTINLPSNIETGVFANIPRFAPISIESADDSQWYVAHISHREQDSETGTITLRVDPQSKKGEFANGQAVILQIKQQLSE